MKNEDKIPRIERIHAIEGFKIYCAFNNGQYRVIDMADLVEQWRKENENFPEELQDKAVVQQVELENGTLTWPSIRKQLNLSNGMSFDHAYDIDPIVLFEHSQPDAQFGSQNQAKGLN